MIRTLLNTLFIQTQGAYLHLEQDTLKVEVEKKLKLQVPLNHLEGIAVFGNVLLSPYLIHRCAKDGRNVVWFGINGNFKASLTGPVSGNVLLRKAQYSFAEDLVKSFGLACQFTTGKIQSARYVLQRAFRDYGDEKFKSAASGLQALLNRLLTANSVDNVRGIEGAAATMYFSVFPLMLRNSEFSFNGREKRPPRDPVNALLSFSYTLLASECKSALQGVGLDPQVGFFHAVKPGRPALALDIMEEFRAPFADRLVLTLINRKQLKPSDFDHRSGGAVYLNENGRKTFLTAYQNRKQEKVSHSLFKESVPIGILPYIQSRILARFIRGDLNDYVPYKWR